MVVARGGHQEAHLARTIQRRNILRRILMLAALTAAMTTSISATASASENLAPTSLSFGSQTVGTSSAVKLTALTHSCDAGVLGACVAGIVFPVTLSTSGDFTQTSDCPPALVTPLFPSSVACAVSVTFKPTAPGVRTGTLSTGGGGPTAALTGTGVATPVTPTTPATTTRKKCKKGKKHSAAAAKKKKCGKKKK